MSADPKRQAFPWLALIVCLTLVALVALPLRLCGKTVEAGDKLRETADRGLELADKALDKVESILTNFHTGRITETFRESYPRIGGNNGDVLEVATNRVSQAFKRSDERRIFWDKLYLGTTTAEIRVDAVFRYHILLSDDWLLASRSNICIVRAPAIAPSLPTAIDTATLEKYAENGWARFDKVDQLSSLEQTITAELDRRAASPENIRLVRDAARRSVAEFVRMWLLKEDHWRPDRFNAIIVRFPDEIDASAQTLSEVQAFPTVSFQ